MTQPTTIGVFPNVPEHEYHSWLRLSASKIKPMAHPTERELMLPAQYKLSLEDPFLGSAPTLLGSGVHLAVMFPETWEDQIRESAYKTVCAKFFAERAEAPEKTWLLAGQHDKVSEIQEAFFKQKGESAERAKMILANATEREVSLKFKLAGEPMKARIDLVGSDFLADIKSVGKKGGGSTHSFARHAFDLGYFRQSAIYCKGAELAGLMKPCEIFYFLIIEVEAPFLINVVAVDPFDRMLGLGQAIQYLDKIQECRASGEWPGYESKSVPVLQHPQWARDKIENQVAIYLEGEKA